METISLTQDSKPEGSKDIILPFAYLIFDRDRHTPALLFKIYIPVGNKFPGVWDFSDLDSATTRNATYSEIVNWLHRKQLQVDFSPLFYGNYVA